MSWVARDPSRRCAVPAGLLGMAVLVAAVETFLAHHDGDYLRFFILDWSVTGRSARVEAPGCTILGFGDSLVKFGVSPRVLEDRLGHRAYNLALCGGQAPSSYFLLKRALEAGARPAAVVVDFMPHLLEHGPRHNARQWPELLGAAEALDLTWTASSGQLFASMALAGLLPSVRARHEIRAATLDLLSGRPASRRAELERSRRGWLVNRGAHLVPEATGRPPRPVDLRRWEDFPRGGSCHPTNAEYVRRFVALAEAHGIRVVWLLPPVVPEAQARREQLGVEARYRRLLLGLQARFANLAVVDARDSGYPRRAFLDPLHLNAEGALALSDQLASVLRAELTAVDRPAGRRWIKLPGFRAQPGGAPAAGPPVPTHLASAQEPAR